MALIAAGKSPSQFSTPSVYYAPRPPAPVAPSSRYTPPAPQPSPTAGGNDWSRLDAFANTEAGQQQLFQSQPQPEQGGFWGSGFGKGLGFIINNPVTRIASMPINYLQTGGRLATLGLEEAAEGIAGGPDWLQNIVGAVPGVPGILGAIDTERTEADKRSNWEKVLSPNTDYGFGQLLNPNNPAWMNKVAGFAGDVALDPLTYISGGANRIVAGASHIDEAARGLEEATKVLRAAEEAGDASQVAAAAERMARAEEYVARAPQMGRAPSMEVPLPRNRAERANLLGELTATPEGRRFLTEMPQEATRAGTRGFQTIGPEAKQLLGIQEPGLRLRGLEAKIPGTGPIAELINRGGGAIRQGVAGLPGATTKAGNVRTPKGLINAFNVLTRDVDGDLFRAATEVRGRNLIRLGTGEQLARGNRVLVHGIKEELKGLDNDAIKQLVREAETTTDPNAINDIASRLIETYQKVTGRTIDPQYLRNPNTYFPHMLDPKWRRVLAKLTKNGNQAASDFMHATGTAADELLEDPAFYADNLLEGSGFLEKARRFGLDDNGNPQTFNIGGKDVTFEADDVFHINEKLREAFPNYKGDFYDTDPVRVFEAYNTSLSRQAGRDLASAQMLKEGNPLVKSMTGDIDATRKAINEALSQQPASQMLKTAQGKYDPTQPLPTIPEAAVAPGSAMERQPIEALRASAEAATDPAQKAVLEAEATRLEAARQRFGDVDPNEYFRTTAGKAATAERSAQATRAASYARAAAAESKVAEEKLRQGVYDLREMIITPLKSTVAETKDQIKALNTNIRKWAKTVKDMGKLDVNNKDELADLITKIEAEVTNAETKLKRTASSWKGRATRAQRSVEAKLRQELEDLKILRDKTWEKARAAPREIREEIELREQTLNQPVRDANERLLRAEMEFARQHPVPYQQHVVADAERVYLEKLAAGEDDPAELLERFRSTIRDIGNESRETLAGKYADTPEQAAARNAYMEALDEIKEIGARPRRRGGRMLKANQEAMDLAVAKRNKLALELGQTKRISPYDQALNDLDEARKLVDQAAAGGGPVGPLAGKSQQEIVEAFNRGEISLADLGKGATPNDLPRLRADRDRLARMFRPGGKFYEEQQARKVLEEMEEYEKLVKANTGTERDALERATKDRATRQESIIWKRPDRAGNRYVTRFGERPSMLEEMGRGVNEQRIVEPIPMEPGQAPQPEAWAIDQPQPVLDRETGLWRRQPIPPPRTELEAVESLRSLERTGGPAAMAARGEGRLRDIEVAKMEAGLPGEIGKEQARIGLEMGARRDQELGPLAERAQTYTNLANDLNNKQALIIKRDEAAALRDRIKANPTNRWNDLTKVLDDLESVAKANPYLDDPKLNQVESLLQTHRAELERIEGTRMRVDDLDQVVADAKSGRLGDVMIATLNNNWKALHAGPLNTGDIIMDAQLHKAFTNLFELSRQPKMLGRTFNAFTNLFKTYATLSPGFFVRNTIGGVFMNTADGVALRAQEEGARLWQTYMKRGEAWLEKQPERVKQSFQAAMASGAGGRFEESGVLAKTQSRLYNLASSNPVTRRAQRWGTRVEGGMRLGMALDSIDNGMGVQGALQRITRVHFDYAQVSELDETMKRIIPFWTFMSRNLPLQIQEQWTNPRVYSYYNNLINNFSLPDEEFTPDYWTRQGAWRTPVEIAGNPLYLQPDLGFTRVQSDIEALSGALGGDNPGLLFSQANPAIGATLDFMNKRDSFYNRAYDATDYSKQSGVIGTPVTMLARLLGQTNEAGQVSDNFTNYLQSLVPPINQAARLFPGASGQERTPQTAVKWARWGGAPIQLLTPEAQDSEYWRQWREMQDEQKAQEAMLREAAS